MKEMNTPEFAEQLKRGPVVFLTVLPNGLLNVGKSLGQWFVYCVMVGAVAGYTAGITLAPGADYGLVFRVVGTVAFAGYALAIPQSTIWWHRSWRFTLTTMFDGGVNLRAADGRRVRLALAGVGEANHGTSDARRRRRGLGTVPRGLAPPPPSRG